MRVFCVVATSIIFGVSSLFADHPLDSIAPIFSVHNSNQIDSSNIELIEWFQGGNIDFISSGLLRSSTNVLLLNLGNPNKFYLPFYLLVGATTDIFKDGNQLNESSLSDLLNNYGGFVNFGINGKSIIESFESHSQLYITYQMGAKTITGISEDAQVNASFLSKMFNVGLMYHTLAWQPDDPNQYGRAWFKSYLSLSHNPCDKIQSMFGVNTESTLYGANFEGGVELEDFVSLRFGYYKYLNNHHIPFFDEGLFKLAADFVLQSN